MQTIIELGRVARDRKTLPIKVRLFATVCFFPMHCILMKSDNAIKVRVLSQIAYFKQYCTNSTQSRERILNL